MSSFDERERRRQEVWEERAERRYEKAADDLTYRPGWTIGKWIAAFFAFILIISLIGGCVHYAGSWVHETKRVVSVPNVRAQTTAVLNDWTSMQAAAQNACDAKTAAHEDGDPTLVEDPALAYKAVYRRIEADYNRRMQNFFEAAEAKRLPLPDGIHGYPRTAPSLKAMQAEVC